MSRTDRIGFASGVFLMVLFACTATFIAGFEWVKQLRFSPLIVGIIIGMIYANTQIGRASCRERVFTFV